MQLPHRLRRNRRTEAIRSLVQETHLQTSDLVMPFFVSEGAAKRSPIRSMPGIDRMSIDEMLREAEAAHRKGILAIALFPVVDPGRKSDQAEEAWNPNGLCAAAVRAVRKELPDMCIFTDVALDPYTSHGHDGLVNADGEILNDETVACLVRMALVQAEAGVHYVAPSDMMDGRVQAIRKALDEQGFKETGILAYSVKYASALYGPFREAVSSALRFGDKKTYQMNPANRREALLECRLDEKEGADILMIKPALYYLDIIRDLRETTNRPIAAYHVSGEYAMVMAAHQMGYLDAGKVFYEALLSIKRAGADLIFTYAAPYILKE